MTAHGPGLHDYPFIGEPPQPPTAAGAAPQTLVPALARLDRHRRHRRVRDGADRGSRGRPERRNDCEAGGITADGLSISARSERSRFRCGSPCRVAAHDY